MNYKRIGRALICLVLVSALLVNVSPIKAEALVPESMVISAGLVVGSILVGLGIGMASDSTANVISGLVDDCVSVIQSDYDFIDEEGLVEIYTDYSAATAQYYVNLAMVEAVREWMFESETVAGGEVAEEGKMYYGQLLYPEIPVEASSFPVSFILSDNSLVCCQSVEIRSSNGYPYYDAPIARFSYVGGSTGWKLGQEIDGEGTYYTKLSVIWSSVDIKSDEGSLYLVGSEPSYNSAVSVSEGLIAHQIAPKDEDFATGYPVWNAGIEQFPKPWDQTEVVTGVPIGLASTLGDTFSLTQEDVQKGVSTLEQGGGDITDPDDGNNDDIGGLKLGEITVTAFVARLLADLTKAILGNRFTSLEDLWGSKWIEVQNSLGELQSAISQLLTQIETSIQNMTSSLSDVLSQTMTSMKTGFESLTQSLTSLLTDLKTSLQNLSQTLTQALEDLKNDILQGVKNLFVPREGYLDSKIDDLTDKYKFADVLFDSTLEMKMFLLNLGQQPPIIYIDLGAAEGQYLWGSRTIFIDLTWYAQYKGTMDVIISAFLWLWFVWRMTLSLPGIIQGTSGFWSKDYTMEESTALTITGDQSHYFRR